MRALVGVVMVLGACGGAASSMHDSSPSFAPGWYRLQFVGARLDARRPNGGAWHTTPSSNGGAVLGLLVGLATGYPAIGATVGSSLDDEGGDPVAPAPFIDLKIEGETFRISPVGTTYAPSWKQPIALDARKRRGSDRVIIQVVDAVDDSTIGQIETTLAELLAHPTQTFTKLGSVSTLDVSVAPMAPRQPQTFHVTVPSTIKSEDLARKGAPGWRPVPVWNGDRVTIEAVGRVCPSSPNECFDANGAGEGRWTRYSLAPKSRHVSLIGAVPGVGLESFGVHRTSTVSQSGSILLFVNDTDVGNNSGSFDVRVVVTPP